MISVAGLVILSAFAVGMTLTSSYAVKWSAYARTPFRSSAVQFLLLMMTGMFIGVLVYFAIGGLGGVVAGLWVSAAIMSASAFLVFFGFLREMQATKPTTEVVAIPPTRSAFVTSVIGLVILTEVLMGWSFSLLAGSLSPTLGPGAREVATVLGQAVVSPWFVFPMALEMVLTLRWLFASYPRNMVRFLVLQPAVMVCSPPTLPGAAWEIGTGAAASALMAVAIGLLLSGLFRDVRLSTAAANYVTSLIISLGLMAAGLYVWAAYSYVELYSVSIVVQMVVFLRVIVDPAHYTATKDSESGFSERAGAPTPSRPSS